MPNERSIQPKLRPTGRPFPRDVYKSTQRENRANEYGGSTPPNSASSVSTITTRAVSENIREIREDTPRKWNDTRTILAIAIGVASIALFTILTFTVIDAVRRPPSPHIIIFLADDLGWADVSFHNGSDILTPNLDAMCSDGIMLNSLYAQPSSSASRAALLTAKYPIRYGLQEYMIRAGRKEALPANIKLLPQYLKEQHYATHLVGKWHLGFYANKFLPNQRGFDSFYGYYTDGGNYYLHLHTELGRHIGYDWHENNGVDRSAVGFYATDIITERVNHLLKNWNRVSPMFLLISHMAPHGGPPESLFQVDQKWLKDPATSHIHNVERKAYAGMVRALDDAFGKTVEALKKYGLLENCIILFSSTNGGSTVADDESPTGASNLPLRGQKWSMWDGGTRVASFIWSPLITSRRYVNNQLYHFTDWLPTFYVRAGGNLQSLPKDIDGYDIWSSITGNSDSPRKTVLINYDTGGTEHFAIRSGRFKLIHGLPTTVCTVEGVQGGWYNDWYKPYGKSYRPRITPQASMKASQTYKILNEVNGFKVRPENWRDDGQLKCPNRPIYTKQNLTRKRPHATDTRNACSGDGNTICLFDLSADPCEKLQYHGVDREDVIRNLLQLGKGYGKVTAKSLTPWRYRHSPIDNAAEPIMHNGSWMPWT